MINFDSNVCTNFESASSREWLETNGIGGFASGTISGANTRRYHGLLTAATRPPLGRVTMLSKFEETLFIDGKPFALSANQYPNNVYPKGFQYLKSFSLNPFPVWIFEIENIEIEKSVFMIDGSNTTVIEYKIKTQNPKSKIELELRPLLSFVDYHHLQCENSDFNSNYEAEKNLITITPEAQMPPLYFAHNAVNVEDTGVWYRNFV